MRVLYPEIVIPDVLYIQPGLGGAGGATSAAAGGASQPSVVAVEPLALLAICYALLMAEAERAARLLLLLALEETVVAGVPPQLRVLLRS